MEKLKQYKYIILISLIILGFAFYWYSYRPYHINKLCINYAMSRTTEAGGDQTDVRYFFWKCQQQGGSFDNQYQKETTTPKGSLYDTYLKEVYGK